MIAKINRQFLMLIPFLFFAMSSFAAENCGTTIAKLQKISQQSEYQIENRSVFGPNMGNLIQGEFSGGETTFIVYQHPDDKGKNTLFITAKVPKKNCVTTYAVGFCLDQPEWNKKTRAFDSSMSIFAQGYKSIAYAKLELTTDKTGRYKGFILRNGSNFGPYEGDYRKIKSASRMDVQSYLAIAECK